MRSRYFAVLETYLRPLFGWWFLFLFVGIVILLMDIPDIAQALGCSTGSASRYAGPGLWIVPFAYLGGALSVHFKGLLGNSTSRLTPRVLGPHFLIAVVITAGVNVFLPAALAIGAGYRGTALLLVAFALAAFSLTAVVTHWWPEAIALVFFTPILLGNRWFSWLAQSATVNASLLIAISFIGVFCILMRLWNFHEEMAEFDRKTPPIGFGWSEFARPPGQSFSLWSLWYPSPPIRGRLRALTKPYPVSQETLWSRAQHWERAWRNYWRVGQQSVWMAAMFAAMGFAFEHPRVDDLPSSQMLFMPLIFAAWWAAYPLWGTVYWHRGSLVSEFIRPYSRRQQVQTVGFVLATATLASFSIMTSILIVYSRFSGFGMPPADRVVRELIFAAALLPLFFAVTVWPFPAANWRQGNAAHAMAVSVVGMLLWTWMANDPFEQTSYWVVVILLAVGGCFATWRAYRRWLDHEVT